MGGGDYGGDDRPGAKGAEALETRLISRMDLIDRSAPRPHSASPTPGGIAVAAGTVDEDRGQPCAGGATHVVAQ